MRRVGRFTGRGLPGNDGVVMMSTGQAWLILSAFVLILLEQWQTNKRLRRIIRLQVEWNAHQAMINHATATLLARYAVQLSRLPKIKTTGKRSGP